MRQRIKVQRSGRGKRKDWLIGSGLFACFLALAIRIPLSRIIGDKGLGFFAVGMEIVTAISVVMSFGLSRAVTVLVKYRIRRDMFGGVGKVYSSGMLLAIAASLPIAAALLFFSEQAAELLVLEHMGYLALAAAAPSICLSVMVGVMRGYFQGRGSMMPTYHSRLLSKFIMAAACLVGASLTYSYGLKVAALLKHEDYAAAYGAMGAAFGVTVAGILGVLHLLLMLIAYRPSFRQQFVRNVGQREESGPVIPMLITTALPYMLCALLYNLNDVVDQRIFNHAMNAKSQAGLRVAHWGIYYGKSSAVVGMGAILCALVGVRGIQDIARNFDKQDMEAAHRRLRQTVHYLAIVAFPFAVLVAVLAEPIVGILFTGNKEITVGLVQAGSVTIPLFAFSYFFMGLLQRIRKLKVVILTALAAFLLHMVFLLVLIGNTDLGIAAVPWGLVVFWLANCVAGLLAVMKYMQYMPDWIRTFGVTALAACAAGLVGMLLCRLLLSVLGNAMTLVIGLMVCLLVYNLLLIVLKGLNKEEIEGMPGGRLVIEVAERLHLM